MITNAKVEALNKYLASDSVNAESLFAAEPAEALVQINKAGLDFTLDELMEYSTVLKAALSSDCELQESDMDMVAGGVVVSLGLCAAYVVGGLIFGVGVGIAVNAKW